MVLDDAATKGIDHGTWLLRLCAPPPTSRHMNGHTAAATERVAEALQTRVVHQSLVADPAP